MCYLPEDKSSSWDILSSRDTSQQRRAQWDPQWENCWAGTESESTGRLKSKDLRVNRPTSPALLTQGLTLINVYKVTGEPLKGKRLCRTPKVLLLPAGMICLKRKLLLGRACMRLALSKSRSGLILQLSSMVGVHFLQFFKKMCVILFYVILIIQIPKQNSSQQLTC